MARVTQAEKDLHRIGAERAQTLLPKLRADRDDLDKRIARLEIYIQAWDELNGRRQKEQVDDSGKKPRAKRGQVLSHIVAVLNDSEPALDATQILDAIKARFGVSYGRSSLYNALETGEKKNRFTQDGKKWKRNPMLVVAA